MEDHIIAAHCALIIGYALYLNRGSLFDIEHIKSQIKDGSFLYMAEIIRKFIAFMKMMVCFLHFYFPFLTKNSLIFSQIINI